MNIAIDKILAGAIKTVALGAALCALAGVAGVVTAQQSAAAPATTDTNKPPATTASATLSTVNTTHAPNAETTDSWFDRPSLTIGVGEGSKRWSLTLFGFVEADFIYDSTRSYDDAIGGSLVARRDTYAGRSGRSQLSVRNSRIGLSFDTPTFAGIKGTALLVGDFFGNQSGYPTPAEEYVNASSLTEKQTSMSESSFFNNPAFRLRHAYLKLQNDYVDVLAGQTYDVFGWQNSFFPCSVEFLGLPNQLFSRNAQLQLSHAFGATAPFGIDVAAAAVRPVQRDSSVPDINAGVRLNVNGWKGITTPGNTGTVAQPLSLGVSATVRQFKVNAFTPPPTQTSNSVTGWGLSVDALVPIIPAANANDRGNRLTLIGAFVTGTGIGDLITAGGGASFPTLPNPAQANPPPVYHANIDNGLVSFDTKAKVQTIDWYAFRAGLQYYLPPAGRLILSANYTQAHSKNMAKLFPKGGAEIELLVRVAETSQYGDINLFWDATPAIRLGLSGQYTRVTYLDGEKPHNLRVMAQALYAF
jgi:hypothetical protein